MALKKLSTLCSDGFNEENVPPTAFFFFIVLTARKFFPGTSLVVQWLGILPVNGTWFPPLIQEDATCRGAAEPVDHSYQEHPLEP